MYVGDKISHITLNVFLMALWTVDAPTLNLPANVTKESPVARKLK